MTRRSPADPAFNRAVRNALKEQTQTERVIFFDTDDQIRHAVYPPEFHTGRIQEIRTRLESAHLLKAVVHVSADVLGPSHGPGPRVTVVEYLPDGHWYTQLIPSTFSPIWEPGHEDVVAKTKELFANGEEGAQQEPPD